MIAKEHINNGIDYAIWLLGRKSYFKKELENKLILKEYTEEEVETIIDRIKSYGYLNDERLTVAFVGDKKRFSKKGPRYIKQSLQQKGVDRTIIEETLEEHYSNEEEFEICKGLGEKKLESYKRRESDKYKLKSKLYAYLASKGFSSDIISKVINQLEF